MNNVIPPFESTSDEGVSAAQDNRPLDNIQADLLPGAPTQKVGLEVHEGGNTQRYMSSDAAPALDQGISPEWTGTHNFTQEVQVPDVAPGDSSRKAANTRFVQTKFAEASTGTRWPITVNYVDARTSKSLTVVYPSASDANFPAISQELVIQFKGDSTPIACNVLRITRQVLPDTDKYNVVVQSK